MNKYAYKMEYVPMASDIDKLISEENKTLSNEVFDKEISKMLKEQCDYVKSVAQAAINSIDAMTAVCGMVFKETINGFPLSEK